MFGRSRQGAHLVSIAGALLLTLAAFACHSGDGAPGTSREPGSGARDASPAASTDQSGSAPGIAGAEPGAPVAQDLAFPPAATLATATPASDSVRASSGRAPSAGGASNGGAVRADDARGGSGVSGDTIVAATPGVISIPPNETIVVISTPTRTPTRTSTPSPTPTQTAGGAPMIGGCQVFPSNNAWNTDISQYPVHPNSANYIANILAGGGTGKVHPDFGSNPDYGIPYIVVPQSQAMVPVNFTDYGDESDPGPYPIPLNAPIEGGSDAHVLAVQQGACNLYELFAAAPGASMWNAASGAAWNLNSNALRPAGWTSADAAGLPVLAGLVRYDEVQAGAIRHALRFTVRYSQRGYILPATHFASTSTDPNRPPMGLRLRLKATYDISGFTGQSRVVLEALRRYGMIVADNGSNWYISGATDPRWDDEDLNQLKTVPGTAFEAVYTGDVVGP